VAAWRLGRVKVQGGAAWLRHTDGVQVQWVLGCPPCGRRGRGAALRQRDHVGAVVGDLVAVLGEGWRLGWGLVVQHRALPPNGWLRPPAPTWCKPLRGWQAVVGCVGSAVVPTRGGGRAYALCGAHAAGARGMDPLAGERSGQFAIPGKHCVGRLGRAPLGRASPVPSSTGLPHRGSGAASVRFCSVPSSLLDMGGRWHESDPLHVSIDLGLAL